MNAVTITLVQSGVVLGLAPLSIGLTRFFRARFQGRHGAVPWLPYITLATLLKKENVISNTGSWVLRAAPYVVLGSSVMLVLILPLAAVGGVFAAFSNFVLVAGILATGSIFLVLGGLDVGSAFGGMGASREMTIVALFEPTILVTFATLAVATGTPLIDGMVASDHTAGLLILSAPYLVLSIVALGFIALAENARYPVDNPATHLELTMVHEALLLDYSGPYLAMMEYAAALKLTVFALLIANLIWPGALISSAAGVTEVVLAVVVTLVKLGVATLAIAILESTVAKMRFYRIQEFLTGAFFLALAGLALALLTQLV